MTAFFLALQARGCYVRLCDWPRPLTVVLFMKRQTQSKWGAPPQHDKAVNELGLEWSPLRSHLAAGWTSVFSRCTIKPPANTRPPSSPKFIRVHDIMIRCSPVRKPVWMQLHSGTWGAWQTWLYAPTKPQVVVLEHHLWLTMTEMKEADKVPFLDAPVLSGSLFGPAVEGFSERFTEAQKSSQAMQYFLP